MGVSVQRFLGWLLLFGLFSSIVLPNINIGSISLYLTTPISVAVLVLVIYLSLNARKLRIDKFLYVLLFVCSSVVISTIYSWIAGLANMNYRDLIEVIKYAQFIPYVMAIPYLSSGFVLDFRRASVFAFVLFLVVSILQVFQISFVSYLYLGSDSAHIQSALSGHRLTLTGSDPNIGGAIAAFFAILSLVYFLNKKSFVWLALLVLCFVFLLMTQSRTALIAFVFSVLFYILFFYRLNIVFKLALVSFLISISTLIFTSLNLDYIVIGIQIALQGENNSLNVRFENLALAYEIFLSSPYLGVGPSKDSLSTIIDSEYALIIQRYGLLGVLAFLTMIVYFFKYGFKNSDYIGGKLLLLFIAMAPFVMLTNNVFSGYQLMSIPVLLYILVIPEKVLDRNVKAYS